MFLKYFQKSNYKSFNILQKFLKSYMQLKYFKIHICSPGSSADPILSRAAGNRSFSQRPKCRKEVRNTINI